MTYLQYILIHASFIPQEVMDQYQFTIEANVYIYLEIRKVLYGLKEAGVVAFTQLLQNLSPFKYEPMKFTPGLWR